MLAWLSVLSLLLLQLEDCINIVGFSSKLALCFWQPLQRFESYYITLLLGLFSYPSLVAADKPSTQLLRPALVVEHGYGSSILSLLLKILLGRAKILKRRII